MPSRKSQRRASGNTVAPTAYQENNLGTFNADALRCIFEKYLEVEEENELHGIPRLVCKHWAKALHESMHTARAELPTTPRERLQLYKDLMSMPCLQTLMLREDKPMSFAEQRKFGQLLRRHPDLSMSGLPALPKLRRLGLYQYPFQSVACPYLELRQLSLFVKYREIVDLSALQHLKHLTALFVIGNDLGSSVRGLQALQSLRSVHLFDEWYGSLQRDNTVLLPLGVTELAMYRCLPIFDGEGEVQLQALSCFQLDGSEWPKDSALFPSMQKLTALEFYNNSPDNVQLPAKLRCLSLASWCWDHWDAVARLSRLEHLEVSFSEPEEILPISGLTGLKCLKLQTCAMQIPCKRVFEALSAMKALELQYFKLGTDNKPRIHLSKALPGWLLELHQCSRAHRYCSLHGNPFPMQQNGYDWGYGSRS